MLGRRYERLAIELRRKNFQNLLESARHAVPRPSSIGRCADCNFAFTLTSQALERHCFHIIQTYRDFAPNGHRISFGRALRGRPGAMYASIARRMISATGAPVSFDRLASFSVCERPR
jgi:hypothetical protein